MTPELWIAGGTIAAWVSTLGGGLAYLHKSAVEGRNRMKAELLEKLDTHAETTRIEHNAVKAQIGDMTKTMSENYVRRDDFRQAIQGFNDNTIELRKDVGEVKNQIIELLTKVEFRRPAR